jgi:hypothetical protein
MGELPPAPGSRLDRRHAAQAVLTAHRRQLLFTSVYLGAIVLLQVLVGWRTHADWTLWLPLVMVPLLAYIHARQNQIHGWDLHVLDEQIRTMGAWQVSGQAPNGDPVTLTGHMVYTLRADVGRLRQFVHVDLDASD